MNINFINDREEYNQLHRRVLIEIFKKNKFTVREFGIFDKSLFRCLKHVFSKDEFFIVSNLKANIATLLLLRKPSVHIINGMGRIRSFKLLRIFFLYLLKVNNGKTFIIQNYGDYRYLKRQRIGCHWISGSGGTKKKVGSDKVFILVSRPSKITFALEWLREVNLQEEIIKVVGVPKEFEFPPEFTRIEGIGRVPQSDILKSGSNFLQPGGRYGEGFPHSLCDALCSGMFTVTDLKTYRKFGMHKLRFEYSKFNDNLISIKSQDELSLLHSNKLSHDYYYLIKQAMEDKR